MSARGSRSWQGLFYLHLYKRIAHDACQAAVTINVRNWATILSSMLQSLTYTDVTTVAKFTQIIADRAG